MATLETRTSSTIGAVETGASSSMIVVETRASTNDRFIVKKYRSVLTHGEIKRIDHQV